MAHVVDLGRLAYRDAWRIQEETLDARIHDRIDDTVLVVEHDPPVYTLGRKAGAATNVLDPGEAEVIEVERGGDVTWHGPGQWVAYPIVKLEGPGRDLHAWLRALEQVMIDTAAAAGLAAGRDARNTGAWANGRKIGSVGIACRRWVTWHGLALNVAPDLSWFRRIRPCGLDAALLSSVEAELGAVPDLGRLRATFLQRLVNLGGGTGAPALDTPARP